MAKKDRLLEPCKNCKCQRYTPCGCMKPEGWEEKQSKKEEQGE